MSKISHTLVSWSSADGGKLPTSTRRQVNTCFFSLEERRSSMVAEAIACNAFLSG